MKHRVTTRAWVAALALGMVATGYAQPDPNEPGKKGNPGDVNMEAVMKQAQAEGLRVARMAPQEREAWRQQMMQQLMHASLDRAGFTDKTLQDTILQFVAEQEKAREPVRVAANKVYLAIEPRGNQVNAATMEIYLNDYQAAVEDAKVQRDIATQTLDQKINFSKVPKLKAWLLFSGVIGEAAWFTGDIAMTGMMAGATLAKFQAAPNVARPVGAAALGAAAPAAVNAPAQPGGVTVGADPAPTVVRR